MLLNSKVITPSITKDTPADLYTFPYTLSEQNEIRLAQGFIWRMELECSSKNSISETHRALWINLQVLSGWNQQLPSSAFTRRALHDLGAPHETNISLQKTRAKGQNATIKVIKWIKTATYMHPITLDLHKSMNNE